jgi:hypothetical protein
MGSKIDGMEKRIFQSYLVIVVGSLLIGILATIIATLGGYMNIVHCPPQFAICSIVNMILIAFVFTIPLIGFGSVAIRLWSKNLISKIRVEEILDGDIRHNSGCISLRITNKSDNDYLENLIIQPIRITAIGPVYLKDLPTEERPFLSEITRIPPNKDIDILLASYAGMDGFIGHITKFYIATGLYSREFFPYDETSTKGIGDFDIWKADYELIIGVSGTISGNDISKYGNYILDAWANFFV